MASWFVTFSILLLFSASVLEARFRLNAKRRYPVSTKSLVSPPYPMADNSRVASDDEDSLTESSTPAGRTKNRASEEQVQQFARLIYERLNLKEPPNVTVHAPDGTGIPSSIVKQLEQHPGHYLHGETADSFQPSYRDEAQPTTERAILPGDLIQHHTCQRQLAVKFGFSRETVNTIECFRFTKSPVESKGLPTNQMITQLRIYVKKNYFQPYDSLANMLTPDMFQVYLVFRPTSNETSPNPFRTLTGTIHLALSQVKQLNDKWLELTISSHNVQGGIQQVYQQLITPWYGVAINRELQRSPAWPSYYRRYHTKKNMDGHLRPSNEDEDDASKDSPQQLPYMLVEYGEKIAPSSAASRGTRGTKYTRPAATCDPKSPCCRRPLTIDLDQGNNDLNFVIYPRKIDIGECVGVCGASGSSLRFVDVKNDHERNEAHSGHNLLLLHYGSLQPKRNTTHPGRAEPPSSQCCSYSRTGGLELMYTTTNGGPIIRKLIPGIIVEECRCGLPATIQQV